MEAFDLDFDQDNNDSMTNNSALVRQKIQNTNRTKFGASTITKGFFDPDQEDQYNVNDSSDRGSPKPHQKKEEDSSKRKRRNKAIKLEPLRQQEKVEVFENVLKEGEKDQDDLDQYDLSEPPKEDPYKFEKKQEPKQKKQGTIKSQALVFQESDQNHPSNEEEGRMRILQQRQQREGQSVRPLVSIPQGRNVLGQFEEDDQDGEVVQAAPANQIAGSQYFNYSSSQNIRKQLLAEIKVGTLLRMELIRDKSGFNTFWPQFHLHFCRNSNYLMSAKKTSSKPCSTFILSSSKTNFEENSPHYIGKMKSNVLGDVLNIFGPGLNPTNARDKNTVPRQLLATVVYASNLFQMGKPREFTLYIKNPQVKYYNSFPEVRMYEEEVPLSYLYENYQNRDKIKTYTNRRPQWVQHLGGYMLNFRGRVEVASIKNFILEQKPEGPEMVVFGKVNESKFNLDMLHPVSPLIAFCTALSSFDSRIMCE